MIPDAVYCEDCGRIAGVRGYGRVEYDWPETTMSGHVAAIPVINLIRLTIDCPNCGVKTQDFWPNDPRRSAAHRTPADSTQVPNRPTRIHHFAPRGPK